MVLPGRAASFLPSASNEPSLQPKQFRTTSTCLHMSFYVKPDGASSEDDEEMIKSILGPLGSTRQRPRGQSIVILSDTTGVTAKSAVEKSLTQFNGCDERYTAFDDEDPCELTQKHLYPFIRKPEEVAPIIERAAERNSMVVSTFADPKMRQLVVDLCEEAGLSHVDLLGPMFDLMTEFFQREPIGMAGPGTRTPARRELTELYYSQVDAIEFTLKADDGMAPWLLPEADIVLVGVSRTGKTPLSVFLSQSQALKVSNIPLVLELDPPKQLFDVDPKKVFCLTLNPIDLQRIRETRLERQLDNIPGGESTYADWGYLKKDLAKARRLADEHGFTEIDVTGRAVEETASQISSMLNERFPTMGWQTE
ncbi:Putative pyruvate, phosphate dikinase regulatory protein [Seminavis robusta]|uniref:Pyruvate, phosphate dikinase regulatory protein n=1 Tax=Seminavis robusta TaxID=568900 RepID=A0A9N8DKT1_9STRA|nr:Putative pyruvate, phosphate dikinase regulatory protein [Seminavis robusta]|eukprot:Sro213_g088460.1 Putative pyruvate, phosphate dikinase regulatory protein (366) ;mRNA; r:45619-46826